MAKFIPCPECGGKDIALCRGPMTRGYFCECINCGYEGNTRGTPGGAKEAWNTREPRNVKIPKKKKGENKNDR